MEIWLDDQCVLDIDHVMQPIDWSNEIADDDAEHELRWVMKHKLPEHTVIDNQGNIIQDATLRVTDLKFDTFELGHVFVTQSTYCHDHNSTTEMADHPFYGEMGCNGTVILKFTTPIYLWLLENL
jgi:hypothetical protein